MNGPISQVLAAARADVGVEEQPRGSNAGPRVNVYQRKTGQKPGAFWCASAVATWGDEAADANGWEWPCPLTASCDVLLDWARRQGVLYEAPEEGDILLVKASEHDAIHTGLVVSVNDDGTVATTEGNSNNGGSRNGYKVAARPRRSTHNLVFVRWPELVPAVAPWSVWFGGQSLGEAWLSGGSAWFPARALIARVQGGANTTTRLTYDGDDNALVWSGKPLPVPVVLRHGSAWGQVRPLANWLGLQISVDAVARRISLLP